MSLETSGKTLDEPIPLFPGQRYKTGFGANSRRD
jgi:hypothetical protein